MLELDKALKGHIALFAAQVIYALNYSVAKGLMPEFIGPFALVFARILGAGLLFWMLRFFIKPQKVEKKDLRKLAVLALFGVVINQVFFIWGLSITTPINSSIIMISNPVMVLLFTLLITRERIKITQIAGLTIAITGATLILRYRGNFELGSDTLAGDVMTLINSASWAIFIVFAKPLMVKYNTVTAMQWLFLFGSIYILPIGWHSAMDTNWSAFTPHAVFALTFVVVATTFLAYLLNLYGLQELSANTVSAYIYLQPFLASLFAILIGEDQLTFVKVISGILIISGLYLVNYKSIQKQKLNSLQDLKDKKHKS